MKALLAMAACLVACSGADAEPGSFAQPTEPQNDSGQDVQAAEVSANPLCVPGQAVSCVGAGACQGGQVCNASGSGFGECLCAPVTNDAGPGADAGDADLSMPEGYRIAGCKRGSDQIGSDPLCAKQFSFKRAFSCQTTPTQGCVLYSPALDGPGELRCCQ